MSKTTENYLVDGYLPTIGIECHVQLKTKTKLFAGVSNDARTAEPNTLISHICLGLPGALPVLNEQAIELASRAAFALGVEPQVFSKFDRKHYFYPDLPKGYQITQFDEPIIVGGKVDIEVDGEVRSVAVTRAHLEEDAGKSSHPEGKDYSLVDLNRAGTPLLEIVSEPDMHSAKEAKAYAKELQLLMRYSEASEADLYQGNMRFDVNVSVSKNGELGTRTETKNLNSFKSVQKACEYEIKRQINQIKQGKKIDQETRGWDDAKQKTFSQRSKEQAHDYRYFPEPDLPPIVLSSEFIKKIKASMPALPNELRSNLNKLELSKSVIKTHVDNKVAGHFMLKVLEIADLSNAKRIANWLASEIQALTLDGEAVWESIKLDLDQFITLSKLVEDKKLSSTNAKVVLLKLVTDGGEALEIAKGMDLLQVSDETEIRTIISKVIIDNPKAVADIKEGQTKVYGYLVGQVMKASKGKANPALAQKLIKEELEVE